jgi:hypothetical protein
LVALSGAVETQRFVTTRALAAAGPPSCHALEVVVAVVGIHLLQ